MNLKINHRICSCFLIWCSFSVFCSHSIFSQPKPGDVFREYVWITPTGSQEDFLRVGGKGKYIERHHPERVLFPEGTIVNGSIVLKDSFDLTGAIKAEIQVEKVLCHDGTRGLRTSVNGSPWLSFPEAAGIPEPQCEYMHHFYPVVPLPMEYLKSGRNNRIAFDVDSVQRFNWPQNLLYGITIRIYYKPGRKQPPASLKSVHNGMILADQVELKLAAPDNTSGDIRKVEYIGYYDGINYEGDGVNTQWHYHFYRGQIIHHIGTSKTWPCRVTWNTSWIPDQPAGLKISARVYTADGLIWFLPAVEDLRLSRDYRVVLYTAEKIPKMWLTREGEFSETITMDIALSKISSYKLIWTTWSPGYMNGLYLNEYVVFTHGVGNYCYDSHEIEIKEPYKLNSGTNIIRTGKTPLKQGEMVHGTEIMYPGVQLLVKYTE